MGKVARRDGMGWGNEDVGETAGEGGGTPPPSLFLFPKPTKQCENHTLPHLSLIIPPEWWEGMFFSCHDADGVAGYSPTAPFQACLFIYPPSFGGVFHPSSINKWGWCETAASVSCHFEQGHVNHCPHLFAS